MKNILCIAILVVLSGLLISTAAADVKLPAVFGDHMVLQQKAPVKIWGWAGPGEKVSVKGSWQWFATTTQAGEDGKWSVTIQTPKAGKTVSLTVEGDNKITLNDILLGEVWICSGQSNMEWRMNWLKTDIANQHIAAANLPQIRLFTVKRKIATSVLTDVKGSWQICSPETAGDFSATGYYFGRSLNEALDVPVGLISTNWGDTQAEAWTSREGLKPFEQFTERVAALREPTDLSKINHSSPTVLYNGMIAPLLNMRIAGAIWYQGESNYSEPILYRRLFPAMITDWRSQWDQGDFPFYYVQIAPFEYDPQTFSQGIREAQMMTLDAVENVGMAVTMDIGEERDIHPHKKHVVGERLARWALAKTYKQKGVAFLGPLYEDMTVEGGQIRIAFDYADDGLIAAGGQLSDFMIAGEDRQFAEAKAVIEGNTVVVSCKTVAYPVAVRYGWSNWVKGTLFNKAGLPASSFRTDDWPLKQ
ncbi:MAG: sialate O-acetylesterase [Planctomycetota bacterium]|jgi:sialate O-acetylesterase